MPNPDLEQIAHGRSLNERFWVKEQRANERFWAKEQRANEQMSERTNSQPCSTLPGREGQGFNPMPILG